MPPRATSTGRHSWAAPRSDRSTGIASSAGASTGITPLGLPRTCSRIACTHCIYMSHNDREVPDTTQMIADFPSGHTIVLAGSTVNEQGLEDMIRGHKATMYLGGNAEEIRPERPFADEIEGSKEQIGTGEAVTAHQRDFLAEIRTGKKPNGDIDLATLTQ